MSRQRSKNLVWHFDATPEVVWSALADTARFNEAAGMKRHQITETPQDNGQVLFIGSGEFAGPFHVTWREEPVNWVSGKWFRHCRHFDGGLFRTLCVTLTLEPDGDGSRCNYRMDYQARGLFSDAALLVGMLKIGRVFTELADQVRRWSEQKTTTPYQANPPTPSPALTERIGNLVETIERSGHGYDLAQRLSDHLLGAQEIDLIKIRPLTLARRWQRPQRELIELCLESARCGLLELHWDLLCPRCRAAKSVSLGLDELPTEAHCDTCNIDYNRDFSKNVEATFQPDPSIRRIGTGEYCLLGPMSTPHIRVHVTVAAKTSRAIEVDLPRGGYRLRTLEAGPETDIIVKGPVFPEMIVTNDSIESEPGAREGWVTLDNRSEHERTFVIEERAWVQDALTADRVTAMQAFRDLFSSQVLRPGDQVAVANVALMFTDLKASTALYNRVGDAQAYHLVREHFAFLAEVIREHNGAVIKTIGDAVMAAFASPGDSLRAAMAVQSRVSDLNRRLDNSGIVIKLGIHAGPCIVVTLNGRLDYFGSTVNLAARLEAQSSGGDIVLSETMCTDPDIQALIEDTNHHHEHTTLRGFDQESRYIRIEPGDPDQPIQQSSTTPG